MKNGLSVLIIIVLILLCFICCTSKKQSELSSQEEKIREEYMWSLSDSGRLSNKREIKLLSYKKGKADSSAEDDTTYIRLCAEWQLDSLDILEILKSSEPTEFMVIDVLCSVLPCEYTGEAIINGKQYKYWINAGGFTALWRDNNAFYLIYEKENNFFLEELWNPEIDE